MTPAQRIEEATGVDLAPRLARLADWGLEEEGGHAVEAWLAATGAPALHAASLVPVADPLGELGDPGGDLVRLLAFSRPIAALLKQNPEFASLVLERDPYSRVEGREAIIAEGRLLLESAHSPSHRLDRLRLLRQKWSLLAALEGSSPTRWRRESEVADALIALARELAWSDLHPPASRTECPALIVGFGKLGGQELNRSSDIDLVYVLPDDPDEGVKRDAFRWAEAFGRAMESPMGRGSLYRVDLRLRPFGRTGEVARSMKGYEAYYRNYAEAWEIQALLRSRPIAGPPELAERWNEMRNATLRHTIWSPEKIAELVEQRERTERSADPRDLKRAAGGIRDVEWIGQIGTLLTFDGEGPLTTSEMLDALALGGALKAEEAVALAGDYQTLRDREDAIQLRGGLQTHLWPDDPIERRALAFTEPWLDPSEFERDLVAARERVAHAYDRRLRGRAVEPPPTLDADALAFIHRFPNAERYIESLRENEGSTARLATALLRAPRLMAELRDAEVLEEILSGEIVEVRSREADDAGALRREHAREWLEHALLARFVYESARISAFSLAFGPAIEQGLLDVLLLGSVAMGTSGPWSDGDILLLHDDDTAPEEAERAARAGLEMLRSFAREGAPGAFDLRLRPDGGKGGLVRSHRALKRYADEGMAPWERLALGNAVTVTAETSGGFSTVLTSLFEGEGTAARDLAREIASRPLTARDRRELSEIKSRVERERSTSDDDLKLGPGGLMDAEWCVRLDEMTRGVFASGYLEERAARLELEGDVAFLVAARRRSDLGAPEPELDTLKQVRARIRARFLQMRG